MTIFDPVLFAKALADETRQKIMKICCCNWLSVNEIVEHLNVTQPTVSHHLAILREAGLVEVREDGKQTFYRLNQKQITVCCGELRTTFAAEVVAPARKLRKNFFTTGYYRPLIYPRTEKPLMIDLASITSAPNILPVQTRLTAADRWDHFLARIGWKRAGHRVEPGLYAVGNPTPDSPVFVSANYTLSFDALRSALDGIDGYILVLDTKGINVWCAAGKGTFGTDEIVNRVFATHLKEVVTQRKLILPQLGAPGVAAHEVKKRTGFWVEYGPVRAADLPEYLKTHKATPQMRKVEFHPARPAGAHPGGPDPPDPLHAGRGHRDVFRGRLDLQPGGASRPSWPGRCCSRSCCPGSRRIISARRASCWASWRPCRLRCRLSSGTRIGAGTTGSGRPWNSCWPCRP